MVNRAPAVPLAPRLRQARRLKNRNPSESQTRSRAPEEWPRLKGPSPSSTKAWAQMARFQTTAIPKHRRTSKIRTIAALGRIQAVVSPGGHSPLRGAGPDLRFFRHGCRLGESASGPRVCRRTTWSRFFRGIRGRADTVHRAAASERASPRLPRYLSSRPTSRQRCVALDHRG